MAEQKPKCVSIPLHILWDDRLSSTEKLLWADINTFDVWYKSLEVAAEQFGVGKTWVSKCLAHLKELGYVEEVANNGRNKMWRALMDANESCSKAHSRVAEKCNSQTEEKTGVGDKTYEIESSIITPQTPQRGASDIAIMQSLVRIFKHRGVYDRSKAKKGIRALLNAFDGDSDSILEAAKLATKQKPFIRKDGSQWKPNFLWFTSPDNTDKVVTWIEHRSMGEEEEEIPEGLREQYDVAIRLGEATDYTDCKENWGMILPKIIMTPEYKELTDGR